MPIEWVQPKEYTRWKPEIGKAVDSILSDRDSRKEAARKAAEKAAKDAERAAKKKKTENTPTSGNSGETARPKAKPDKTSKPDKPQPLAIGSRPPRGKRASDAPPRTYSMGTERPSIGSRGPLGNPGWYDMPGGESAPSRTFTPEPPKALASEGATRRTRTVEDERRGREELGRMVQDVMSRRQGAGGGSGDTGEIVRSGSWAAHGRRRNDLTIAEGEIREPLALPTRGSASTGILPTIGRTQDIPRVTPHDQTTEFSAIPEAKKPFAARNPIPVGAGRTPEQLALFHASGEPLNPSLSTRQQSTLVMPTVKKSGPKRVATKLAARPSLPKEPGSQGTLFHPSRYKIAP